jgi:hypothetical protein
MDLKKWRAFWRQALFAFGAQFRFTWFHYDASFLHSTSMLCGSTSIAIHFAKWHAEVTMVVADGAASGLSEYEAKRLHRIEENRQKLRELKLPILPTPAASSLSDRHKKRKREAEQHDKKPLKPVRKSRRQRKKRRLEREKQKLEKSVAKQEKKARRRYEKQRQKEMKRLLKRQKLEKKLKKEILAVEKEERRRGKEEKLLDEEERLRQEEKCYVEGKEMEKYQENDENHVEMETWEMPPISELGQPRISDWRLRRKLQAREERRKEVVKRQEVQRRKRMQEKIRKRREQLQERAIRKKEKDRRKREKNEEKQRLKLLRRQERKMMQLEDRLAQALLMKEHSDARRRWLAEKQAVWDQQVDAILAEQKQIERAEEWGLQETRNKEEYPVRQLLDWPFVRISDGVHVDETKPRVLTPLLKVDADRFHFFSLGKQFIPPGRQTVTQALCPGGYTAVLEDNTDIYDWKNAMTLFISSSTDTFYRSLFQEETIDNHKHVSFRWDRFRHVPPDIRSRMSQIQRGERQICFDEDTYNVPTRSAKPEPLLLFIQYPNVSHCSRYLLSHCAHSNFTSCHVGPKYLLRTSRLPRPQSQRVRLRASRRQDAQLGRSSRTYQEL